MCLLQIKFEMRKFNLIFLFVIIILIYYFYYDYKSDDDIEIFEEKVITELYNKTIKSEWILIKLINENNERNKVNEVEEKEENDENDEIWLTHILKSSIINKSKENILLLHGYGATSAITWRVTIPGLVEKFNVTFLLFLSFILISSLIYLLFE